MLDARLQSQLRGYLARLRQPIILVASLDGSSKSRELVALLEAVAGLSDQVRVVLDGTDPRRPSFLVTRPGTEISVRFAGLPLGHEFTSLVLALLHVGGHPAKESAEVLAQIATLDGDYNFETYFSLSCQNCPDVVQALNLMAALNPRVRHVAIDGASFQDEVEARGVLAVPSVFLNGQPFAQGRMTLEEILTKIDQRGEVQKAAAFSDKAPFEVLVVGGGPAGAAAAIYAARKGIRTGIVTERFGGQVLDTLGIENFISVQHIEGPKLVAELERHVRDYEVEIMTGQRAISIQPAMTAGGLAEVVLASGAKLRAKTVILSTGARWRSMNVPGEAEYRNKGVAYCPHCDGPLFKGKRVAVIGGGNSGVEAAIDLAGIAAQVTLVEYEPEMRADAVLQARVRSLRNVTILTGTRTTAVEGDGQRVTGILLTERNAGTSQRLALEGIFVQIGLVPNTEWLRDALALSPRGEIEVDARSATSLAGVYAAGDATTVPHKQIIVAMGEGAKAALSAFEHLIRHIEAPEIAAAA